MQLPPECPLALALSFAIIRAASYIVPSADRKRFEYEWRQKLHHRWQFLLHTGLWNVRESFALLASSVWAVPSAIQHFGAQESVRTKVSRFVQSPATCLGALSAILLLITVVSGGLPSTRDLFLKKVDPRIVYVWCHNLRGGGDRPLPGEVVEAWKTHSSLITGAAPFRAIHREIRIGNEPVQRGLVVTTEPSFFQLMGLPILSGDTPTLRLSYDAWVHLFHASPRVIGGNVEISGRKYRVAGILPSGFDPLSRQPALYLVQPKYFEMDAYGLVKVKPGVTQKALNKEFVDIAQNVSYYFLQGQVRYGFAQSEWWAPVRSFAEGALASAVLLLLAFRIKWSSLWPKPKERRACLKRSAFFAAKTFLGLAAVFTGCLEWSRSSSAILFGNFDPASGPFLLWLYILGTMGVFFWAAMDQKARCRECLELLAFPVRMGSPGNLLLDWSGIELCCTQGHGVLHVPHLAPSWAEESGHWIALDDSWQAIFGHGKNS